MISSMRKSFLYKNIKYKKTSGLNGHFFCDQHFLQNQISIDDINKEQEDLKNNEDKIGEAGQEVAKQKSKKKKITNAVLFALNIVIVIAIFVYQLSTSEVEPFSNIISSGLFKWQYIFVIAFCFCFAMFLETMRATILLKQSSGRTRPALCYKMIAIGRYYDAITPMATGGQPFQIFYLNNRGVDAGTAISIPLARYVVFQIAWTIIGVFAIFYSSKHFAGASLLSVASYIGFILNALMLVGVVFLSLSKRVGKILVAKSLKLLHKMHIVKNYEKVYDSVLNTVNGFQSTMATYTKNFKTFIMLIITNLLQFIFVFMIPFFIYLMLGGSDPSNAMMIIVYSLLIDLASGFIPLPGGTGMSELTFTITFASIFPNGTVFWGLLLWRFMHYYIYILQGLGVLIYDYSVGNKKYQWQKKKWELEAESNKFKKEQLLKYNKRKKSGKIRI